MGVLTAEMMISAMQDTTERRNELKHLNSNPISQPDIRIVANS